MCANLEQIKNIAIVNEKVEKLIKAFMPGPITLILKKKKDLPAYISNRKDTIAVRMATSKALENLIIKTECPIFMTSAKVVEGLVDESTFINNVKVIGHYLEAKAEDKDDVPVKVYENVLKIRKVSKEYNQYTKLPEGSRINAVFELLDENKKYIDTLKVNDKEDYIYKYLETGKTYYLKEISVDPYYVISDKLIEFKFEKNGQIIELEIKNDYVTADYQKTELKAEDDAHTIIYTKTPNIEKELPKTGIDD